MGLFRPNIDTLIESGDTSGLVKLLTYRKADVRLQAFLALAKSPDERVLVEIKKLLNDKDPKVRAIATLKFGELGEPGIVENLQNIIVSGSQRDKIEALRILAGRGRTDDLEISKILYLALCDKKPMVKIEAIKTMGAIRDKYSVVHLVDKLDDVSFQIRLQSAKSLGEIGEDAATSPLIGALVDNHSEVRKTAQEALRKIGTERAMNALNDAPFMLLVKRMTEGEFTRRETLRQIGQLKIKEGVPLVKKACFDEYKNVRIEAVRAIGLLREKSAVEMTKKLLDDPYFDVRIEAVKALEKLFDPGSLAGIEKALHDKNHNVRDDAKAAYYSLKSRLDKVAPPSKD